MLSAAISTLLMSFPISNLSSNHQTVALTFDACETEKRSGFDHKIYTILKESQVSATIFLGGKWAESHPKESRLLSELPHIEIAQHSYIHPHYLALKSSQIVSDMLRAQAAIKKVTGKTPLFIRPPYGESDSRVHILSRSVGLQPILWSIVSGDPDPHVSASSMKHSILKQVKNGSIIIMHINGRGWHTAEALPTIISELKKRKFEFITVGQGMNR